MVFQVLVSVVVLLTLAVNRMDFWGGIESHEIILHPTFATSEESAAALIRIMPKSLTLR
jgi:hypothetical protein